MDLLIKYVYFNCFVLLLAIVRERVKRDAIPNLFHKLNPLELTKFPHLLTLPPSLMSTG